MMPKLAFPIVRLNFFRTLGPLIEEACKDPDWEVELWLGGRFFSEKPGALPVTPEKIPAAFKNLPGVVKVPSSMREWSQGLRQTDAVVSPCGPWPDLAWEETEGRRPLWCAVFDADHSVLSQVRFHQADLHFWPSRYYLDWASDNDLEPADRLEAKGSLVGYVRADTLKRFSRHQTRESWGLDLQRPVVLYIPDGYRLLQNASFVTDWYRHVWCVDSVGQRLWRALIFRRSIQGIREALSVKESDVKMMEALHRFCKSQGAQLVLYPRKPHSCLGSTRFTRAELQGADRIVQNVEEHPQTLLQAIQMADLVVFGYRSGAVLDALAAGTPCITIGLPPCAQTPANQAYSRRFDRQQGNRPGATWLIPSGEFVNSFTQRSLLEFRVDPVALESAREKYVGPVDGLSCQRVLSVVRQRLEVTSDVP